MFDSQGKDDVLKLSNVMKMSKSSKDDEEEVSGKLCYLIALNCWVERATLVARPLTLSRATQISSFCLLLTLQQTPETLDLLIPGSHTLQPSSLSGPDYTTNYNAGQPSAGSSGWAMFT